MRHTVAAWALALTALAGPVGAVTTSSPGYTINGGGITSGGGSAGGTAAVMNADVAIGQGVLIPATGSASAGYAVYPVTTAAGGACTAHGGDINCDGVVDIADALLALKAGVGLVHLSASEIVRGDVGPVVNNVAAGDGRIDIEDAMLILRTSVGLGW